MLSASLTVRLLRGKGNATQACGVYPYHGTACMQRADPYLIGYGYATAGWCISVHTDEGAVG